MELNEILVYTIVSEKKNWEEIVKFRQKLADAKIEYFYQEVLFTPSWWLLLLTSVAFIITWLLIVDKSRIVEIICFGLLTSITAVVLDSIGVSLLLWGYPKTLTPLIPPVLTFNLIHMPVIYMVVYQFFSTWRSFFVAMFITVFIFSFVFEPLLVWLDIYDPHQWKYVYSFPIYLWIAVVWKWTVARLKQIEYSRK